MTILVTVETCRGAVVGGRWLVAGAGGVPTGGKNVL